MVQKKPLKLDFSQLNPQAAAHFLASLRAEAKINGLRLRLAEKTPADFFGLQPKKVLYNQKNVVYH